MKLPKSFGKHFYVCNFCFRFIEPGDEIAIVTIYDRKNNLEPHYFYHADEKDPKKNCYQRHYYFGEARKTQKQVKKELDEERKEENG